MTSEPPREPAGTPLPARLLRNVLSNFAAQFVTLATAFALTPFVLSHLGRQGYGLWVLIVSIVGYGTLLDLGVSGAAVKYTAEFHARGEHDRVNRVIGTVLTLYTALGLAFIGVAAILAYIVPRVFAVPEAYRAEAPWIILVAGIGIGVGLPGLASVSALRGLQRFDVANGIGIAGTLLSAGATVVVLSAGGGLLGLAIVNAAVNPLTQVPVLLALRRIEPRIRVGWRYASAQELRRVVSFSSSVAVVQFSGILTERTDPIVIGGFLRVAAVTPYALAQRLAQVVPLLARQFTRVIVPFAAERAAAGDTAALRSLTLAGTRVTLAISVPLTIGLAVLGGDVLSLWVGEEYRPYAYLITILAVNGLLDTASYPGMSALMAIDRHRPVAWMALADGVGNLVLSLVLVYFFGLAGVAAATVISTVAVLGTCVLPYTARHIGFDLRELARATVLRLLFPAAVFLTTIVALRELVGGNSVFDLIVCVLPSAVLYAFVYVLAGAPKGERDLYRSYASSVATRVVGSRR